MPRPSPNVALTSNLPYSELSSEAKQLIAQIKCTAKEQVKQEIISEIDIQKKTATAKTKKIRVSIIRYTMTIVKSKLSRSKINYSNN